MKQRYDSYKPSGIEWIGEIPSHWKISPIKHICRTEKYAIKTGPFGSQLKGEDLKEEGDVRVYNQRNVIESDFSEVSNYVTTDKAKDLESFYTLPNDLLVTSRGTIGKSAVLPDDAVMGILHPCLIALRINESKANLNWIQRWINESDAFSREIEAKSNATTIDVIYTETIKNIRIALPPLVEQEAIAAWLDEKCQAIDAAIAKVDREIELIDELKQSEISRIVTRGLNPDAHLRHSGIDWIGDVPEHWKLVKMSRILKGIQDGTHGTFNRVEDGQPLLSAKNVFEDGISITENESQISQSDFEEIVANGYPRNGDIALCCVATIGRGCIYTFDFPMAFQRSVTFLRIQNIYSNRYVLYYLRSLYAKVQFETYAKTSAQSGVYMGDLKKFWIILPPLSEQQDIADYLDKKCAEIDGLKEKLIKKRETLKELRQAIISEVVTGKRKVI